MNSGLGEVIVCRYVSTHEPFGMFYLASNPWSDRGPWLNTLSHKAKQKDENIEMGFAERFGAEASEEEKGKGGAQESECILCMHDLSKNKCKRKAFLYFLHHKL